MKFLAITTILLLSLGAGANPVLTIDQVKAFRENDKFIAEIGFKGAFEYTDLAAEFVGESIQIEIPNAKLAKNKQLIKVEDPSVRSVYTQQASPEMVRFRISLRKGLSSRIFENSLKFTKKDGLLTIEMAGPGDMTAETPSDMEIARAYPVQSESPAAESNPAAAGLVAPGSEPAQIRLTASENGDQAGSQSLSANADMADNSLPQSASSKNTKESEIPVSVTDKKGKKEVQNPVQKTMITLGVMAVLIFAVTFGLRKWAAKRSSKNHATRIKILTQHHMGPKKQLAIIQVAGESLLIGVTDHSITMLKTLSLLDEEIPEDLPSNFASALDSGSHEEYESQDEFAFQGLNDVRDQVSTRTKNMRRM